MTGDPLTLIRRVLAFEGVEDSAKLGCLALIAWTDPETNVCALSDGDDAALLAAIGHSR